jgi:hypothetical protein
MPAQSGNVLFADSQDTINSDRQESPSFQAHDEDTKRQKRAAELDFTRSHEHARHALDLDQAE